MFFASELLLAIRTLKRCLAGVQPVEEGRSGWFSLVTPPFGRRAHTGGRVIAFKLYSNLIVLHGELGDIENTMEIRSWSWLEDQSKMEYKKGGIITGSDWEKIWKLAPKLLGFEDLTNKPNHRSRCADTEKKEQTLRFGLELCVWIAVLYGLEVQEGISIIE